MLGMHRMWGYKPEEAMNAPLWVLRASDVLLFDQSLTEKRAV